MAWIAPISTATTTPINLGTADNLFIAGQVAYTVDSVFSSFSGTGSGQRVVILGTLAGNFGGALGAVATTGNLLEVGAGGRLQAFTGGAFALFGSGKIVNQGTISSFGSNGIELASDAGFSAEVVNSGLIEGAGNGIVSIGDGLVVVSNSGTIQGDDTAFRDYFGSQDLITNTGLMVGDILLGVGNDVLDGRLGRFEGGSIRGGIGNDRITTGAGSQTISGGTGNDTLTGGAGADTLLGDDGFDHVSYAQATSRVVVNLASGGTVGDAAGDRYEDAVLGGGPMEGVIGSAHNDSLTGNAIGNRILGGNGNDTLDGKAGNDTVLGGAGQDTFVFSTALSTANNRDRLSDYVVADDQIQLDDAVFAMAGPLGALAAGAFAANATGTAADADDRIIYNTATGILIYDSNGDAAGGVVQFAVLSAGLALTASEFSII
jgi:Ca2+-binding RTX toxin-like protein